MGKIEYGRLLTVGAVVVGVSGLVSNALSGAVGPLGTELLFGISLASATGSGVGVLLGEMLYSVIKGKR